MPRMLGFIESRNLWCYDPFHHTVGGLEHDHIQARFAAGGRDFEADIPATDDDRAPPGREFGAQPIHIRDGSQVVHAGEFSSRERQQAGMSARGQQQRVVLDARCHRRFRRGAAGDRCSPRENPGAG